MLFSSQIRSNYSNMQTTSDAMPHKTPAKYIIARISRLRLKLVLFLNKIASAMPLFATSPARSAGNPIMLPLPLAYIPVRITLLAQFGTSPIAAVKKLWNMPSFAVNCVIGCSK